MWTFDLFVTVLPHHTVQLATRVGLAPPALAPCGEPRGVRRACAARIAQRLLSRISKIKVGPRRTTPTRRGRSLNHTNILRIRKHIPRIRSSYTRMHHASRQRRAMRSVQFGPARPHTGATTVGGSHPPRSRAPYSHRAVIAHVAVSHCHHLTLLSCRVAFCRWTLPPRNPNPAPAHLCIMVRLDTREEEMMMMHAVLCFSGRRHRVFIVSHTQTFSYSGDGDGLGTGLNRRRRRGERRPVALAHIVARAWSPILPTPALMAHPPARYDVHRRDGKHHRRRQHDRAMHF